MQDPQAQINWISLDDVDTGDQRLHNFRFLPAREPGVYADIDEASSPFDAFVSLFDDEVQNKLINAINEYAAAKTSINTTLRKESRFSKWYPIKRYELMKFLAVIIGMGIDRRSSIDDYWRLDSIY